jgi:tripartite-type tricarboxylate transporter receptor subunit TctC
MKLRAFACVVAGLVMLGGMISPTAAQTDFFKGKTITIVLGTKSGSIAVAAQIVGRHLGKYIPGNPAVINQQMPGGAHLVATNYVYNVAEANGLTLLAANPQVGMAQLNKVPTVRFDVRKFNWLGSTGADGVLMAIRPSLPFKTFKELQASGHELVVGSTGPGSNAHDFPLFLGKFAGIKVRFVSGYAANSDILLAVERKEVDAWTALSTTVSQAGDRGAVRPLVRSRAPVVGYKDLPVDEDLATDPLGKALMKVRGLPLVIGRAFAVRPGVLADRVALLREAFKRTVADPQFISDMKTAKIEVGYLSADDVIKGFDELMSQPPKVVTELSKYIKVAK